MEDPQILATALTIVGILAGLLAGLVLGRGQRRTAVDPKETERLRQRLQRAEIAAREKLQEVNRLQSDQGNVASLALSIPAVVRELNRSDLDSRTAPRLILNLAESIFQPEQILLYGVRGTKENPNTTELQLLNSKGLSEIPDAIKRVAFGEGKIGWAAQNKVDMLDSDWFKLSRNERQSIPTNHPMLNLDIVGPLLHFGRDQEHVLGVLCIGRPKVRPRDEKLMFQLVTNLGSLALVNARNVSRLRAQANTDGLTGLLNKRSCMTQLAEMLVDAGRAANPLSLFIFDIDHFKNYNDTNGHPAGDELLRGLSNVVRPALRPNDLCCRYGGEEFLIVMPGTEIDDAMQVAEDVRSRIEQKAFAHQEKQPNGNLTISGGVATFPAGGSNMEELVQNADVALYQSKHGGRNTVSRFKVVGLGGLPDETDLDAPMQLEPTAVTDES